MADQVLLKLRKSKIMKQIEFYPSRGNYRVWDEDEEKWFADFNSARKYLTDNWQNV